MVSDEGAAYTEMTWDESKYPRRQCVVSDFGWFYGGNVYEMSKYPRGQCVVSDGLTQHQGQLRWRRNTLAGSA